MNEKFKIKTPQHHNMQKVVFLPWETRLEVSASKIPFPEYLNSTFTWRFLCTPAGWRWNTDEVLSVIDMYRSATEIRALNTSHHRYYVQKAVKGKWKYSMSSSATALLIDFKACVWNTKRKKKNCSTPSQLKTTESASIKFWGKKKIQFTQTCLFKECQQPE